MSEALTPSLAFLIMCLSLPPNLRLLWDTVYILSIFVSQGLSVLTVSAHCSLVERVGSLGFVWTDHGS